MQEMNLRSRARGISQAALVGFQLFAVTPLPTMRIGAAALTIPSGTDIPITVDQNIALKQDQIGKTFPAHVTRNVLVNGAVAIPAGAPAARGAVWLLRDMGAGRRPEHRQGWPQLQPPVRGPSAFPILVADGPVVA